MEFALLPMALTIVFRTIKCQSVGTDECYEDLVCKSLVGSAGVKEGSWSVSACVVNLLTRKSDIICCELGK